MMIIQEWQRRFAEIYPNADYKPDYLMVHLYTNCSSLGESILKQTLHVASNKYVIHSLAWANALASHFEIDYAKALFGRFPGVCPYCLSGPCKCSITEGARDRAGRMLSEQEKALELENKSNSFMYDPSLLTYNWFAENINRIYPSNKILLLKGGQSYVVSKFLEEGGELHRAYSAFLRGELATDAIKIELADLTSWVISCWDIPREGRDLDKELISYYYRGCPTCRNLPCRCPSYSITAGVEEAVRDIAAHFRSLKNNISDVPPEVDETLRIAEGINASRKFSDSQILIKKAEVAIAVVEKTGKFSETATKLIVNIKNIVGTFAGLLG